MSYSTWIGMDKKTDKSLVSLRKKIVNNKFSISPRTYRNIEYFIFDSSKSKHIGKMYYQYGNWIYRDYDKKKYYEVNSNGALINGMNW